MVCSVPGRSQRFRVLHKALEAHMSVSSALVPRADSYRTADSPLVCLNPSCTFLRCLTRMLSPLSGQKPCITAFKTFWQTRRFLSFAMGQPKACCVHPLVFS